MVLHADDLGDGAPLLDLRRGDVAEPDVPDEPLLLQFGQRRQRCLDRAFGGAVDTEHDAQIDHVEHLEPEIGQVVVHRLGERLGRERRVPGAVGAPPRPDLGDDGQIIGIGVERLPDDAVGDVRAVEIAGVDVVDALLDRRAQHREGAGVVFWRAEDAWARELHGAIAQPLYRLLAERIGAGLFKSAHEDLLGGGHT